MSTFTKTDYVTDVLVIGGGIAAVFAALRAKANGANVIMVDKGSIGRSGQTPFASAMGVYDEDEGDDRTTWHKIMEDNGLNLNNPAYLDLFMDYSKEVYEELVEWGATDVGFGNVLRTKVMKEGIQVIERTMMTNLLESSGTIGGAIGFKLDQEETIVIKAKAVILCTGAGGFKPNGFQVCSLTFDGDAMAYRVGAKISGKEFVDTHFTLKSAPAYCWGQWQGMWGQGLPKLTNPLVEGGSGALDLTDYHIIHETGVTEDSSSSTGDEGERPEGPPSEADGEDSEVGERPSGPPEGEEGEEGQRQGGRSISSMIGGASAGLSVHKAEGLFPADNQCGTNIKGLYAAGDCLSSMLVGPIYDGVQGFSMTGSATQGAVAGKASAQYIETAKLTDIGDTQINAMIDEMVQPLNNEQGYGPEWVEHLIQGTLIPYYVLYIKHIDRMNAALTNIKFYQEHFAGQLRATDLHGLRKAHEVKNMLLNAEMKLKASLYRTESRGNHYREDYPASDDQNWLAWVVIQQNDQGDMQLEKFMREDFKSLVL